MNCRGLTELIVLNLGLDLGIIGPKLFTMLVIMALVTTVMTVPALNLLGLRAPAAREGIPEDAPADTPAETSPESRSRIG
jgi:Kef-type K+ transport system membrane component KefB